MSVDMVKLEQRVASLEKRLVAEKCDECDETESKEASQRNTLLAAIASLETRLASDDKDEDDKAKEDIKAADAEMKEEKEDEKKASELDPNGIEEQITQDSFSEVEGLAHGTELTDAPSMNELARKAYVAKLKNASTRLDRVAEYLEKHGRRELAFRIDKIADAIDSKIKAVA